MSRFAHDLRLAVRQLARNPGFAIAAIVILGLGIGLNSAVFSVVNAVLFRPLPVAAPEELVAVYRSTPEDFMSTSALSSADYEDLAELTESLTGLLAYTYTPMAVEHAGEGRLVLGVRATPNFFSTLGVKPFLGRFFAPADGPDVPAAVLSYAAWRRRFGADRGIVGEVILLNGSPFTVIGVAPEEFFGLTRGVSPEVWTPLTLRGARERRQGPEPGWLWVLGRRAPGASFAQAQTELRALAARLAVEYPASYAGQTFAAYPANAVRILPGVDARMGAASAVVLGVVGLVLLIACSNVAHLLLARAVARRREIATRRALGASPFDIVRQLLVESLLLALLGGALGLGLAWLSNAAVAAIRLPLPIDLALGLALDGRVVLFTLGVAALTSLVFGLAPALTAARGDLGVLLREGEPVAGSRAQRRFGSLLVIVQVALSFVLLVDTGLVVRSLRNASRVDAGFDPHGVVVAAFAPQLQGYGDAESERFFRRLTERVRELPEIEAAGQASHLPLTIEILFERVAPAATAEPPDRWPSVDSALVGPGYFETLRIPRLRGRTFTEDDDATSPPVAVINQSFAARFWPGQEPVGQRLRVAGAERVYEVVGVVGDGKYRTLADAPRPFLYRALAQKGQRTGHTGEITSGSRTLVARVRGPASEALADLRRLIREIDPRIAVVRLETLEKTLSVALFLPRVAAVLFAVFGLLGLLLATLGIYSLMVYTVRRRHREIGVRMALGAAPRDVLLLIVRRGLGLALLGLAAGLAAALATTRALAILLYGVSPTDPATFLAVSLLLAFVALAASYLPARRAAGLDVVRVLREGG